MNYKSVILVASCLIFASVQAGLNSPSLVNPSFEDPALAAGGSTGGVTDWYDSVGYTYTADDGAATHPETPYGDNWSEFGQRRWMYQQIGTYDENMDIEISFLMGARSDKGSSPAVVGLLVGGNPALAADLNTQFLVADFGNSTNPLVGIVGATLITTTGEIAPFSGTALATSEQSMTLSTGTGYAAGTPLWLQIYCPITVAGRLLIDNVVVALATNDPSAINPTPNIGAPYVDPMVAMSWGVQNATSPSFDINIGTTSACNEIISGVGTGSVMSYTPPAGLLDYATEYFWRVDVTDGGTEYPGSTWFFTTGGEATDPVPASGLTADRSAGALSWSGDALIASYDVYFGLPGDLQLVDNYVATSVSFSYLGASVGQTPLPAGDYQWRVDTLDGSDILMVTGDVWDVTIPEIEPIVLDDFTTYNDTSEMLANWSAGGGAALVLNDLYGSMQFDYDSQAAPFKSEATLTSVSPQDWAATGMDTFSISLRGLETNDPEPIDITLNDGTVTATASYPQADTTTDIWWNTWFIRLSDFSDQGLDLSHVTSIAIGVGHGSSPGGAGTIYIDDLQLELPGCIAAFWPEGDLNKDCRVTLADVSLLSGDWLLKDFAVSPVTPTAPMLAHYQFNETAGSATAADSSGNGYTAAVDANDLGVIWNGSGHDGGCIELDSSVAVTIPAAVLSGVTDEVTIAMWVSGDPADYPDKVNEFIFAAGGASGDEFDWDNTVWDIAAAGAYGPQWNHYAAVKDTATGVMAIYHNGILIGQTAAASDAMEGSLAGDSILSMARFDAGTTPTVKVDDLRIYGDALSQAEIADLAGGPVVQPIEPIYTEYDLSDDGSISLPDFAAVAQDWLEQE